MLIPIRVKIIRNFLLIDKNRWVGYYAGRVPFAE
jgi:hypothetical protein